MLFSRFSRVRRALDESCGIEEGERQERGLTTESRDTESP
jgi:hypothetical protein